MTRSTVLSLAWIASLVLALALIGPAAAQASASTSGSPTLDAVKARGRLVCGVNGDTPGFSLPDGQGIMRGIDADYCRAIAAAVLGDANALQFAPLTTENRFAALESGQVDVLVRETTWTLGREASLGVEFAGINFYDGTGFLVKKSAGITSAKQLDGASICVAPGSSTEVALADYFRTNIMKFRPVEATDLNQLQQLFLTGQCDAFSSDSSALAAVRFTMGDDASNYVLLPEVISKEPLGPAVRKGDDRWFDIIRWVGFALLDAEEKGVTSKNVDEMKKSDDPDVRRLLGVDGDLGTELGIDNAWAYNAIKQVGNYAEISDRDMAPMGIPRGLNRLWKDGGLMYAPPLR